MKIDKIRFGENNLFRFFKLLINDRLIEMEN